MAGINLQGGFGAGAAVDELHRILAERFREQQEKDQVTQEQNRLAEAAARREEDARQANLRNAVDLQHVSIARDTAGLARDRFSHEVGQDTLFNPLKVKQYGAEIANTEANTGEILRQPTKEQQTRDFQVKLFELKKAADTEAAAQENKFRLGQIELGNKGSLDVANARSANDNPIPVVGPSGTTILVPKSQSYGMTPGVNPRAFSSSTVDKLATIEQSLSVVNELNRLKKDEWLGPVAGYITKGRINMPGIKVPEDLAAFAAQTARLKDATIQAITGAAVGVQESKRIMGEIPDFTDKPEVWNEKAKATVKNLTMLHDRTMQLSGKTPDMAPSAASGQEQGTAKTITMAELQKIAQMKDTDVATQKARYEAGGYVVK